MIKKILIGFFIGLFFLWGTGFAKKSVKKEKDKISKEEKLKRKEEGKKIKRTKREAARALKVNKRVEQERKLKEEEQVKRERARITAQEKRAGQGRKKKEREEKLRQQRLKKEEERKTKIEYERKKREREGKLREEKLKKQEEEKKIKRTKREAIGALKTRRRADDKVEKKYIHKKEKFVDLYQIPKWLFHMLSAEEENKDLSSKEVAYNLFVDAYDSDELIDISELALGEQAIQWQDLLTALRLDRKGILASLESTRFPGSDVGFDTDFRKNAWDLIENFVANKKQELKKEESLRKQEEEDRTKRVKEGTTQALEANKKIEQEGKLKKGERKIEQGRRKKEREEKLRVVAETRAKQERGKQELKEKLRQERIRIIEEKKIEQKRRRLEQQERLEQERLRREEERKIEQERIKKEREGELEQIRLRKIEEERAKVEQERKKLEQLELLRQEKFKREMERTAEQERKKLEREKELEQMRLRKIEEERAKVEQERKGLEQLEMLRQEKFKREMERKVEQERKKLEQEEELEQIRLRKIEEGRTKVEQERKKLEQQELLRQEKFKREIERKVEEERKKLEQEKGESAKAEEERKKLEQKEELEQIILRKIAEEGTKVEQKRKRLEQLELLREEKFKREMERKAEQERKKLEQQELVRQEKFKREMERTAEQERKKLEREEELEQIRLRKIAEKEMRRLAEQEKIEIIRAKRRAEAEKIEAIKEKRKIEKEIKLKEKISERERKRQNRALLRAQKTKKRRGRKQTRRKEIEIATTRRREIREFELGQQKEQERRDRENLMESWKDYRKTEIAKEYISGKYADLYRVPAWPFHMLYTEKDNKALFNVDITYNYATDAYDSDGSTKDVTALAFGEQAIQWQDLLMALRLDKKGVLRSLTITAAQVVDIAAGNEFRQYPERVVWQLIKDNIADKQLLFLGESEEYAVSFNLFRYIRKKDISIGASIPFGYKAHKLKVDSSIKAHETMLEAIKKVINLGDNENRRFYASSIVSPVGYVLEHTMIPETLNYLLAPKGLSYLPKTSITGIGDVSTFINYYFTTKYLERFLIGGKITWPTAKEASTSKVWAPELGTGFTRISAYTSMLFNHQRGYFNPHMFLQASWNWEGHKKMRVPKIRTYDGADPAPPGNVPDIAHGDRVQYVANRAFTEYDTQIPHFADNVADVKIQPGAEVEMRIGNIFEKLIFRRDFLDIYYNLRVKWRDDVGSELNQGVTSNRWAVELLEDNTYQIEHKIGMDYSYQFDPKTRMNIGWNWIFAGRNVPAEFEARFAIGVEF